MRQQERQHYWDVTRAALMLLGLPYHVAMLYHPGGWIVDVDQPSPVLGGLAAVIHAFRMPAFFVVAGYFAAMLLERRAPGVWLKGRVVRLGIPLVISLFVLVPVLNILAELSARPPGPALHEWTYQTMTSGGYWVRHLWFLIVLLYLSAGAAMLARVLPAGSPPGENLDRMLARHMPLALLAAAIVIGLWVAVTIEGFYAAGLNTNLPQQILRIDDLLMSAPYFAAGALLQRHPRLTEACTLPSLPVMLAACLSVAAMVAWGESLWPPAGRFLGAIAAMATTQVIVSLARAFLDRPSPLIRELVAGSFVIYLFHLPILIGLYDLAKLTALPPIAGFPLILAGTMGLSWAVWLGVRRSPALNLLFNGIVPVRVEAARKAVRREVAPGLS